MNRLLNREDVNILWQSLIISSILKIFIVKREEVSDLLSTFEAQSDTMSYLNVRLVSVSDKMHMNVLTCCK